MKRLSSILAAALLTIAGYAAEQSGDFAKAQAELKARAPEDYAKIEKLAATDLNAAMREFRAAAKRHGIKLPRPQIQRSRRPGTDGERPGRGERMERGERQGAVVVKKHVLSSITESRSRSGSGGNRVPSRAAGCFCACAAKLR